MNVTLLFSSISRAAGGIFDIGRRLAQELHEIPNTRVCVVGTRDNFTNADAGGWQPVPTFACTAFPPRGLRWSPSHQDALANSSPHLIHQHGIWNLSSLEALRYATATGVPYAVSVHGMIDPWALGQSRWKKRIAWTAYQRRCLEGAGSIFVNSQAEANQARNLGLSKPIAIVPNGVDLPPRVATSAPWQEALGENRKVILFLGRIHPKKGLFELVRAWASVVTQPGAPARDWSLVITGWDDGGHEQKLRALTERLGLSHPEIYFTGPLFGADRDASFQHAAAFVLPSFSEGMPMAVLEAMAHGLPILKTTACNIPQAFAREAAISIEPTVDSIRGGLVQLMGLSSSQRTQMGDRGRTLVQEQFTWKHVARETRRVYAWLLGQGDRPTDILV